MEHAASTHPWLVALEQSWLGQAMRESPMLYPAVEILHIIGFALLLGSIATFDLRVIGLIRAVPAAQIARIAVPLSGSGLVLAVTMGLALFSTEATHIAVNPAFQFKLACIAVALLNLAWFHFGPWRTLAAWGVADGAAPASARIGAAVSLLAWLGALTGGRLIAYF